MELFLILLFSLAVSSDGFMVGIAYGAKKIRIPIFSLLVISIASALAVTLSMLCGKGLVYVISPFNAKWLGASILVVLGAYFLVQSCKQAIHNIEKDEDEALLSLKLKSLGIVIQILKEPSAADIDASGVISAREAFFLGMALAMDAFGAGIGVAMAGFNIFLTAITVGMLKFILVGSGIKLGTIMQNEKIRGMTSFTTGLILIAIGLCEVI